MRHCSNFEWCMLFECSRSCREQYLCVLSIFFFSVILLGKCGRTFLHARLCLFMLKQGQIDCDELGFTPNDGSTKNDSVANPVLGITCRSSLRLFNKLSFDHWKAPHISLIKGMVPSL